MSRLTDAVYRSNGAARDVAGRLDKIANALDLVGSPSLADKLAKIADDILAAAEELDGAYSDHVTQQFQDSVQNTNNVVTAVIEGIRIGQGESKVAQ